MSLARAKDSIRTAIISAAKIYSSRLSGKVFLYVYGDKYVEVLFPSTSFLHLTGVESRVSSNSFYAKSKDSMITTAQFYFSQRHPMSIAKKKLTCLIKLPRITTDTVCILNGLTTKSVVYRVALTNLEFTLGLVENDDIIGRKVFVPMTLRVNDKSIEKSGGGEFVDFIFSRDASESLYSTRMYSDTSKEIPNSIKEFIANKS